MSKYYLPFALHNHQPVGNFDHVFAEAVKDCYEPFLKVVSRHPFFRFSLHFSGPLWEWIEDYRPEIISLIGEMVSRGQVELMAGGFYEPLLPFIPEVDAVGQIRLMLAYLEDRFDVYPKGLWVAERVWDPLLPRITGQLGIKYTLLDDSHFLHAGLKTEEISDYYVTEKEGYPLAVFPISQHLRYLIPFHPPQETIEHFQKFFSAGQGQSLTYGDDGEKFGIWPGTRQWVYKEGWLEKFLKVLENNRHWLEVLPLGDYLERFPPRGRLYLPPASYEEMMEWALLPQAASRYATFVQRLKAQDKWEDLRPFVRGGTWDNFLIKYEETNLMHKKMLHVSRKVAEAYSPYETLPLPPAVRELWRGQCNCAYWHGLFGGLYLNHLREAVYEHLIAAEGHLPRQEVTVEVVDFDCDGQKEWLFSSPALNAYIKPAYGGSIYELDLKGPKVNLSSVLMRRPEAYHEKIKRGAQKAGDKGEAKSIHEQFRVKESGLERFLIYDRYSRYSFLDHLFAPSTSLSDYYRCSYQERGDFVRGEYQLSRWEHKGPQAKIELRREGFVDGHLPLHIVKTFFLQSEPPIIEVIYQLNPSFSLPLSFAIELNLNLGAPDDPQRFIEVGGRKVAPAERRQMSEVKEFSLVDEKRGWQINCSSTTSFRLWLHPIETVHLSEAGAQRSYQGTCITMLKEVEFVQGEAMVWPLRLHIFH